MPDAGEATGFFDLVLGKVRRASSNLTGRSSAAELLLLRDLRELYLASQECEITWVALGQSARAARDKELEPLFEEAESQLKTQAKWLKQRIKQAVPQAIVFS